MEMTGILIATAIIGGTGLFIGLFLGMAGLKFRVEINQTEEAILNALPGNNCGGCGYAGCAALAAAIAKKDAPVSACPVGGAPVAGKIAELMDVDADEVLKMAAFVRCSGDCDKTTRDYEYTGVEDCGMLFYVPNGGPKSCNYGCLGYGNCIKVCEFDAIHVVNGVAVVDRGKCVACGKCVSACPKRLIEMSPLDAGYAVACKSQNKGPVTTKQCQTGCIACGICVKQCEYGAITVEKYRAYIDQDKCVSCGKCIEKCPKKTIVKLSSQANC